MKVKLVFKDWHQGGKSIYELPKGLELSKHNFHSGSSWDGKINLAAWEEKELREAIENGYQPVFGVTQ